MDQLQIDWHGSDDSTESRMNIAFFLRTGGYQVNEASNETKAIELSEKDILSPSIVFDRFAMRI
jgi:CheY-like chemotaxis protein